MQINNFEGELSQDPEVIKSQIQQLEGHLNDLNNNNTTPQQIQQSIPKNNSVFSFIAMGMNYINNNQEAKNLIQQQLDRLKTHLQSLSNK